MDSQQSHSHWVLIETGGNQRYIFASNRLRHVVGASQLVHEIGTEWIPQAVDNAGLPARTVVMTASGKALLLVDSRSDGQAVIRTVTRRALSKAPGLQVTGVVGPPFDPEADPCGPTGYETALAETYSLHAEVRAARADPLARDRVFPWHELCRDSGQPAAREERYGGDDSPEFPWQPASNGVLARSAVRERAERRIRTRLADQHFVIPTHLDELHHSGWIAVVHVDGNGVGALFRDFASHVAHVEHGGPVPLETYVRYQHDVAQELDDATWNAVVDSVQSLPGARDELAGRFLPIVVGGDDVTVACDAALALPFVRTFSRRFEQHTAKQPTLSKIIRGVTGRPGLTASAGIAVVKLHHPFSRAYDLAEALTLTAKQCTDPMTGRSPAGFDLHVAHTSTLRELEHLRESIHGPCDTAVARYAGPYLLDTLDTLPDIHKHRSVDLLDEIARWMAPEGWLSATQAHALRDAAGRSLAEYQRQLELVVRDAQDPDGDDTKDHEARHRAQALLGVQSGPTGHMGTPFLRLFDVMHLHGLRLDSAEEPASNTTSTLDGGAR